MTTTRPGVPDAPSPRRGEIYLVAFDPALGAEIQKTRPAVVIQNDLGNRHSRVTIVAAISSRFRLPLLPVQVLVGAHEGGLDQKSVVLCNQIRSMDRQRLVRRLGEVSPEIMDEIDTALAISLGLAD